MNKYYELLDKIERSKSVLIVSHKNPDADSIGSAIAVYLWLSQLNVKATMACYDPVPDYLKPLPFSDKFIQDFSPEDYDLIIFVDNAASYMSSYHTVFPDLFENKNLIVNIDHHASNDDFGGLNIVETDAASTTILLYRIFDELSVQIDDLMATALLAGIYGDTGSFMHSNTNAECYSISAHLLSIGANVGEICKNMFKTKDVDTLRAWGKVFLKTEVNSEGVVVSAISKNDMSEGGFSPKNISGVIDYLNMIPNSNYALLLVEDGAGRVKGSLRTNKDIDVSNIAKKFGGGGHPKASGFTLEGQIKEEKHYKIVPFDVSKQSSELTF